MADSLAVTSDYKIAKVSFDIQEGTINIVLKKFTTGWTEPTLVFEYVGDTATQFIQYVNTADFTTTSLKNRILNKLVADGKISGTVS